MPMTQDRERITRALFDVIQEFNRTLPPDKALTAALDTTLYGKTGVLDSLGLVNLIVATEQRIEEDFGVPISLADERAMSQEKSPFRTVDSLVAYIALLLGDNHH
jgi:D-alanine--poly(phosphoribitol) ligase subunit 2